MTASVRHLTKEELAAGLHEIRRSPKDDGVLEMIVRRPEIDTREVLEQGELDPAEGLVGDTWRTRSSRRTPDESPHPDMQLNIMNARAVALVAQESDRWPRRGSAVHRPGFERGRSTSWHAADASILGD